MHYLQGIPISNGIIQGSVFIKHDPVKSTLLRYASILSVEIEIEKYMDILNDINKEFQHLKWHNNEVSSSISQQMINLYSALLSDPVFTQKIPQLIKDNNISAPHAVVQKLDKIQEEFANLENKYFRSRFYDFKSIGDRILDKLCGNKSLLDINSPVIIATASFSLAELLQIPKKYILAILSETGGTTSHAAILSESISIPAVFGIKNLLYHIQENDQIIVNGYKGNIIINPSTDISQKYLFLKEKHLQYNQDIQNSLSSQSQTLDNQDISIQANASNITDIENAQLYNADGVGLLRTEVLALTKGYIPDEEEQYQYYKELFLILKDKPIYIRILDLGGDKFLNRNDTLLNEANPFLGYRSIRMFIEHPNMIKSQFYAIIRASHYNRNIKVLFPFITTLKDIIVLKELFYSCYQEIHPNQKCLIPIGIMAEIPAIIICLKDLLPYIDFVSIGTNDLTQYTLAVDRNNSFVSKYYQVSNPAVFRLIASALAQCNQAGIPISICGEICKDPIYSRVLLGMGAFTFSMTPSFIPLIKYILTKSNYQECRELWKKISTFTDSKEIDKYLSDELDEFLKLHGTYFEECDINMRDS